jgi:hypothetical protein
MMGILTGVRWNLSVVLICFSFMATDGEHFSCVFWSFEFLLLRKLCLVSCPFLNCFIDFGRVYFLKFPVYTGCQSFDV